MHTYVEQNTTLVINLPVIFCILVDTPVNHVDCSDSEKGLQTCFNCTTGTGQFIDGGKLDGPLNSGRIICIILWIFCLFIGIFGTISNYLIISVLRKHKERKSFDVLLIVLAWVDMINTATSTVSATAGIAFFENWNRGLITLLLYYVPLLLALLGRSASTFMTVLITVERYMVIKFFMSSSRWFSATRTKLMATSIIGVAFLLNFPRFTTAVIEKMHDGDLESVGNASSLQRLQYVIRSTSLERFWYTILGSIHYQIDMWLPFPILITCNVLLYLEIRKFTLKRQKLTLSQKTDIRAARMFLPVIIVLCICNAVTISAYIVLHSKKVFLREMYVSVLLSIATNSSANLPIYYSRGSSFRKEIRAALPSWMRCHPTPESNMSDAINSQSTGTLGHL